MTRDIREVAERARVENLRVRGIGDVAASPQQNRKGERRVAQRAKREGKELTPKQIARRAKFEENKRKAAERAARFKLMCKAAGLPIPQQEVQIAPPRKWSADFAWEPERVMLEVEGAVWAMGRHNRGSGFLQDVEKYNTAALRGWLLLRVIPKTLCTEETIAMVKQALNQRNAA